MSAKKFLKKEKGKACGKQEARTKPEFEEQTF